MGSGAAFFDLDRTVLKGASGPLITKALQSAGLAPDRSIPGQSALYTLFDVVGETLPAMALARGAALLSKGWAVDAVRGAGKQAADELESLVAPWARTLIEDHKSAGRPTVLATTTPYELVMPLAERLGFDDVVATRYAEDDGTYTGRLEGEFVWAAGKRSAVTAWADAHDVDLSESYAYSDSVYDVPLLSTVGHPHAVNPDPRLQAVALVARWPVLHLDAPPGVPKLFGAEPLEWLRRMSNPLTTTLALPFVRLQVEGTEHIPKSGPVILVGNHRSYFDPFALSYAAAQAGRILRFLGKKEVFDAPLVGQVVKALGNIRVDRGTGSDAPLKAAARALSANEAVCILPQGTIPRGRELYDPVLKGRPGAARLARATGAPLIPLGLWGTEHVWPRSSRVPQVWQVTSPPKVLIRAGAPITLTGADEVEDTEQIMSAITALLPPEARLGREPTAEEIRRATPSSSK